MSPAVPPWQGNALSNRICRHDMRRLYLKLALFCVLGILLGLFAGWTTGLTAGIVGGLVGTLSCAFLLFSMGDQVAARVVRAGDRALTLTDNGATMLGGLAGMVGGAYLGGWLQGPEIMGALALAGALGGVYLALVKS